MVDIVMIKGTLRRCTAEAIVCPVDCQGAAATAPSWGPARQIWKRFPAVFEAYAAECKRGAVTPGSVHVYEAGTAPRLVVLVAVKDQLRDFIDGADVDAGLAGLRDVLRRERVSSVGMGALDYEPEVMEWDDAWPTLQGRIRKAFRRTRRDLRIEVYAPYKSRGWPAGCPSALQLRAGRALSGWGVRELADAASMSPTSVSQIENHRNVPHRPTLEALQRALETRGIEFAPGGWVRLRDDRDEGGSDFRPAGGGSDALTRACVRALEHVEKAGYVLRRVCPAQGLDSGRKGAKS